MSKIRTRDLITYLKPLFLFFVGTLMWLELIDSYYQSSKQLFCLQYSVNDLTISSLALFCLSIWLYLFVIVQPVKVHNAIQNMAYFRSRKVEDSRVLIESAKRWTIITLTTIVWDASCYGHVFWWGILMTLLSFLLSCLLVSRMRLSSELIVLLVLVQVITRLVFRL
ncbi:hypothetical protein BSQ38_04975 [Pediococcus damnosus]|nr:hypothetical protein BSQ38_04975 [Pediococcus damnosus]